MDNENMMNNEETPEAVQAQSSKNAIISSKGFIDPNVLTPHEKNAEIYGDEDVSDLVAQIKAYGGIAEPIRIKQDGVIISGHRRWKAARELGMTEVPYEVVSFDSNEEELAALVMCNYHRQKTNEQRARKGIVLEQVLRTEGMERKIRALKQNQTDRDPGARTDDPGPNSDSSKKASSTNAKGRTRDQVAEAVKISSGRSYERMKNVVEAIDELDREKYKDDIDFVVRLMNKSVKPASNLVKAGYFNLPDEEREHIRRGDKPVGEFLRAQELAEDKQPAQRKTKSFKQTMNVLSRIESSVLEIQKSINFLDGKDKDEALKRLDSIMQALQKTRSEFPSYASHSAE